MYSDAKSQARHPHLHTATIALVSAELLWVDYARCAVTSIPTRAQSRA